MNENLFIRYQTGFLYWHQELREDVQEQAYYEAKRLEPQLDRGFLWRMISLFCLGS